MGGVLLKGKLETVVMAVAKKLNMPREIFDDLDSLGYHDSLTGKLPFSEFIKNLVLERKLEITPKNLLILWKEVYLEVMHINTDLLDKAKELKEKYKVALISNLNDYHGSINYERNLFDLFEPKLLSYEVGLAKPDPLIFELVLEKLGEKGEDCIFIDDREKYFPSAKSLGINCIQYINNEQVFDELEKILN